METMDDLIDRIRHMSEAELEIFLEEGARRARHILDVEYDEDRDFRIVGEEILSNDLVSCSFEITTEGSPLGDFEIDCVSNQLASIPFAA